MMAEDIIVDSISNLQMFKSETIIDYLENLKSELIKDTKYLNGYVSILGIEFLLQKERKKIGVASR